MDGYGADASLPEERRHEFCVALRDAEAEGARAALRAELLESVLSSALRGDSSCERLLVEPRTAPRDVRVVHLIWDAEIMERRE